MTIVAVLMLATFIGVLSSTTGSLKQQSNFALNDALNRMNGPEMHGEKPGGNPGNGPGDRPGGRLMPIITVWADSSGNVTDFSNQIYSFSDSEVAAATRLALSHGSDTGILKSENLRYMIRTAPDGSAHLAFIDNTMETNVLSSLLMNSAIIGAAMLLLFFGISILLSRWVARPVEKAWDSQRRFVADASHELKTPLTVILANSALLSRESAASDEKTTARLDNILDEAKRMKMLIDNLLSLARSDEAAGRPHFEKADFSAILENAALSFEPVLFEMGKQFTCDIAGGLVVMGDAAKLRQLAEILLDNACKYARPESGIRLTAKAAAKGELRLEVENESEPIPKEELTRIFERFYRLDKARSGGGYGLGLSIASVIVREHDGKIWAECEGGRTVFTVTLPAVR
jgi:signal transduction histidine kinase